MDRVPESGNNWRQQKPWRGHLWQGRFLGQWMSRIFSLQPATSSSILPKAQKQVERSRYRGIKGDGKKQPRLMPSVKNPGGGLSMNERNKDIWFPARKYGVGWGFPITWQGWVVFGSYIALVIVGIIFLAISENPILLIPFMIYIFLLSGVLIFICFKKGEKIDFRWGNKS
jgi:hypothetical protein